MSDDSDHFEFADEEIDDQCHEKLVDSVLKLNKAQQLKNPHRTEPTTQISEFNLVKSLSSNQNVVHVNELTKGLKGKASQVTQKLKSTTGKNKTLLKPIEKHQAERIRRTLNYEKSRLELDRWEALVTSNRAAPQLIFPLDSIEKVKILEKKAEIYPSTFRIKSDLQKKLEALEPPIEEYKIDTEEKDEYPLTLEELKEKRKERAKLRAHQSFKEAKARRQNKIKSKKYHRILRREKIKQKLKEFEELQKVNPEEALKKLEDIEKARAEERFSLRHKGASQWARNKQVRAKYDKESRQELAKQLAISRELTQKVKSVDSGSEDEGVESGDDTESPDNKNEESNPWVSGIKPTKDVIDFVSGYKKYWNQQNQKTMQDEESITGDKSTLVAENDNDNKINDGGIEESNKKRLSKVNKKQTKSKLNKKEDGLKEEKNNFKKKSTGTKKKNDAASDWCVSKLDQDLDVEDVFHNLEQKLSKKLKRKLTKINRASTKKILKNKKHQKDKKIDLSMPQRKKKPIIDEELIEQTKGIDENEDTTPVINLNSSMSNNKEEEPVNINPDKFINVKQTVLNTAIPDLLTTDENEECLDQKNIIMEAFEDDDIAADFSKEKTAEIERDTPKDIDLNLPGWGSWAGTGINPNKRKKKRFIIKAPPKMPRRDANKGSLIINEKAQSKVKPLLVSEIPFPFKSVKDYEASIRAPIGRTFVPETAFRKLIEPSVVTKMGTIIEPINKSILMGVKKF
ncbi:U3 small nucleolar RNA-associated protein 14 homolog A [Diorhabda carinulata]|uniref:U3 small nucleolar RNA-associated protein 14 homolog A n=1 Tax=Diorhabda carinulata TaxID=1163345 RepID=UPI0025A0A767|nr:U3 small nucleolar RNA-associated protein 14 homolog A [Diorhabda carinulata]